MPTNDLYAEFTAIPGSQVEVAALLRDFAARVRQEPGNVAFAGYTLEGRPRSFFIYEAYADQDAVRAHSNSDYVAEFNHALGPLIEEDGSQLTWLLPI